MLCRHVSHRLFQAWEDIHILGQPGHKIDLYYERFTLGEIKLLRGALIDADGKSATVLLEGETRVVENVPIPLNLDLANRLEEGQELDCRLISVFGLLIVADVFVRVSGKTLMQSIR